ncbi:hypothetical protein [Streptomyces bobili]|uniref:hypothetical protein n=1 Tax=Streptomyces bobili TaxID=67280 RepID=UPI0031343234
MEAIHSRGLVHRDLKAAKIILAEDGPHVLDFGIARPVEGTQYGCNAAILSHTLSCPSKIKMVSPGTDPHPCTDLLAGVRAARGALRSPSAPPVRGPLRR